MRRSLKLRMLGVAALWIVAALVGAGLLISALLRDFVEATFDERLNANLVAVMTAVTIDDSGAAYADETATEPGFTQPFSGWYWQVANGQQIVLRSPSLWDQGFGSETGTVGSRATVDKLAGPDGETLRAATRDFTAPGGSGVLRVTVAGPQAEIDEALASIIPPLVTSLIILGIGLIGAVLVQIVYGLRPLDRMRLDLAAVRDGKALAVRDQGYVEIAPLTGELNALIEHNRLVIERARKHVGNLAHGLKTPLAVLANAATRPDADRDGAMTETVRSMERLVQHHLRRARSAASRDVIGMRTPVAEVLNDLRFAMERIHADRRLSLDIAVDGLPVFAGERHDLEEMLGNLIDNACKWAATRVECRARTEAGRLVETIDDDGPGLAAGDRERALARGVRLDELAPGSGLGLAIVRDLAELYGGGLELSDAEGGGLQAVLTLPGAAG